nr:uncharacterized protein LOC106836914 isoform X2 [Equus asinus]XP_044626870.1 uncharacterized protein LOC106836914 isoform X2 [Equus asinus]XP_044626871.1 uncharacterized protein LOC106836914 isoform X2 [Equus asinus]
MQEREACEQEAAPEGGDRRVRDCREGLPGNPGEAAAAGCRPLPGDILQFPGAAGRCDGGLCGVPCRIPSALCASRPSSGPGIQTHGGDRAAPGGYKSVHLAACGALWGLVPGCGAPERGEELQPVLPAGALIPVDQKDLTPLQRQEELLRAEN